MNNRAPEFLMCRVYAYGFAMNSQKTLILSPSWTIYGVSFESILENNYEVPPLL